MCPSRKPSLGAWIAIGVAVTISILTSFGAFAFSFGGVPGVAQ